MTDKSKELLDVVLAAADDKIAQEVVALDVNGLTSVADYFVVMNGKNEKQVKAIVAEIEDKVWEAGFTVKAIEGKDGGKWMLMDLIDVIVHVFAPGEREFYNLERLWRDAPIVNVANEA